MKQIPLTQGKYALVDDEDYDFLTQWKWHIDSGGYATRSIHESSNNNRTKFIMMHRVVNKTPAGLNTDHINMNPLDNRKENLRNSSHAQNMQNRRKNRNSSSRFKGVTWNMAKKKWQVYVQSKYVGYFEDEHVGAMAYDLVASYLFGEFASTNFPVIECKGGLLES